MSPWAVHHSAAIGGGEMIIQIFSGIGIGISIEMIAVVQLLISLFPGTMALRVGANGSERYEWPTG
ncbi:GD12628 [Drosophila simulans]|uniref:GD12628 n=1 Tax=Drosophila simulans TaxID=7240 RepID=B4QJY3_DROSI|nr:GD12628 [Drosophila simulans]